MRWYIFASSALAAGAIARLPAVLERLQLIYNSIGKISGSSRSPTRAKFHNAACSAPGPVNTIDFISFLGGRRIIGGSAAAHEQLARVAVEGLEDPVLFTTFLEDADGAVGQLELLVGQVADALAVRHHQSLR